MTHEERKIKNREYMKCHRKMCAFDLYDTNEHDREILSWLETKKPIGKYLKGLVEKDMQSKD